jgi:hypothetical protein
MMPCIGGRARAPVSAAVFVSGPGLRAALPRWSGGKSARRNAGQRGLMHRVLCRTHGARMRAMAERLQRCTLGTLFSEERRRV